MPTAYAELHRLTPPVPTDDNAAPLYDTRAALALWSGEKPTLAKDPFGVGPLRLKRDGEGWTLCSLGPERKDDGGKRKKGNAEKGCDLVVRSG